MGGLLQGNSLGQIYALVQLALWSQKLCFCAHRVETTCLHVRYIRIRQKGSYIVLLYYMIRKIWNLRYILVIRSFFSMIALEVDDNLNLNVNFEYQTMVEL